MNAAEAKNTTAGWEIERLQTEDCLMQIPGSNMGANVYPFLKFYTCCRNANLI
jgi:hypothetical protein